ncbi:MAG TPA: type III-B CRISPR module-associated protein Cmr5 [Aggregatilineales bacterium]|nr:type III-B CRISPR module-associated protein Cmr5 [Anaerolineales bacterium]HRE46691.1 type III-B CRISPR module-associated protein Cmr5 [Aggregatilineales bacterium]
MTNQPSNQQTLQQKRAAQAWKDVQSAKKIKEYPSLVKGFAANVQRDGLGASLAFLQAKGKDEHNALNRHLSSWVLKELGWQGQTLLETLLTKNTADYRRATAEVLAYLLWLKRFAEGQE